MGFALLRGPGEASGFPLRAGIGWSTGGLKTEGVGGSTPLPIAGAGTGLKRPEKHHTSLMQEKWGVGSVQGGVDSTAGSGVNQETR